MKSLKQLLVTLIVTVATTLTYAQDKGLLYEISGNGIETSYLYGTIHLMPPAKFEIKETIKTAFDNSENIILELDMDDPNMQGEFMKNIVFTDGNTLDQLFEKDELQLLDSTLIKTVGVGIQNFNAMKPFMVNSMLVASFFGERPASYEATFVQWAKAQEKDIQGLETVAEQVGVFDKIPYEDQADRIIEALEDMDATKKVFDELIDLYLKEDIEALYKSFFKYYDGDVATIKTMLDERNIKWIPAIETHLKKGTSFIGVGAGHLGGDNGVINLLRAKGYTLKPVTSI